MAPFAPAKFVDVYGAVLKTESSYGAGATVNNATDGILSDDMPKIAPIYANDGKRPAPPSALGSQRGVVPSGKTFDLQGFKHSPKLPGSAFSNSVFWTAHNPLRWCGMDAAVTLTGGSEKWVYTPTPGPTGYASGAGNIYVRGELWPVSAILGDWVWQFKGPEVPYFTFNFKGLLGQYSDTLPPSITYPYDSRDPLKAVSLPVFSLFGVSQATCREATIKYGRTLKDRLDVVAGGSLGHAPERRNPTLEVLIETPAIATEDFFSAWEAATVGAFSMQVNTVQYNRLKWAGNVQLSAPPKLEDDGAVALSRLTFRLLPSAMGANDDISITTD